MSSISFFSRKNQVYPVLWQGRAAVEKHFSSEDDWRRELDMYRALDSAAAVPSVYGTGPRLLVLEYLPLPTLLEQLQHQEDQGYEPGPWEALAEWLRKCRQRTGMVPGEGNLRNFLWDPDQDRVVGIDLEYWVPEDLSGCGARLAAAVLDYAPAETEVKRRAAAQLAKALGAGQQAMDRALEELRRRRSGRRRPDLSGIVLAGGMSRRMGRDKSSLDLAGRSLLALQVEKMRSLGIRDILISGAGLPSLPGTRPVADIVPGQGPMGGLHACLRSAECSACLVLSVDVPLIPAVALFQLCREHTGGVTLLRHSGMDEPLIGVYDRALWRRAEQLMMSDRRSVRALGEGVPRRYFDYLGPGSLLKNANTPDQFRAIQDLVSAYAAAGLPLIDEKM